MDIKGTQYREDDALMARIDVLHETGLARRMQLINALVTNLLMVGLSVVSAIPNTGFASQGRAAA